jgi:hypothetical protein
MKKLLALVSISSLLYLSCATNVVGTVHDSSVPLERSSQILLSESDIVRYNGVSVDWKKSRDFIQIPAGNTLLEIDLKVQRTYGYGVSTRTTVFSSYEGKMLFAYNFQPNKKYLLVFFNDTGTTNTVTGLFGNQVTTTDINAKGWGYKIYVWEIGDKLSKAAAHYLEFVPFLRPETVLE